MKYFIMALKKYAQFSGRSTRAEYWYFVLFNMIIGILLQIFIVLSNKFDNNILGISFLIIYYLYVLAVALPSFSVSIRRLHDTNRSGWWVLLGFIPMIVGIITFFISNIIFALISFITLSLVATIIMLAFLVQDSQSGENKYGPNPKAAAMYSI